MTDRANAVKRDLGRHLQQSVGEVIARHMAIIGGAVDPADAAIMLIEVAVSITLTAAASVAATTEDQSNRGAIFDTTLTAIASFAAADRDRSLAAVAAKLAEARS